MTYTNTVTDSTWTFTGDSGLATKGSGMYGTANDNTQVAYLQSSPLTTDGAISESVDFPSGGTFDVSFIADSGDSSGQQDIAIFVDGNYEGDFQPIQARFFQGCVSYCFSVAQGDHTITIEAEDDPSDGNYWDLIDNVTVNSVTPLQTVMPVLDITTSYNSQGLTYQTTSYSSATGGSGAIVNQIQDQYNGFGQLTQQYENASGAVVTSGTAATLSVQYAYATANTFTTGSRVVSMTYPSTGEVLHYNYGSANGLNDVISRLDNMVGNSNQSGSGTTTLQSYTYVGLDTVVEEDDSQDGVNLTYQGTALPTPAHEWTFDDGSGSVATASIGVLNGTLTGQAWQSTGVGGGSLDFNYSDGIDLGAGVTTSNTFTISAWIDLSTASSNIQTIMANKQGGAGYNGFGFSVNTWDTNDGRLNFETGDSSGNITGAYSIAGAVPVGQWVNVAVVVDESAGTAEFYVDGKNVTENDSTLTDFSLSNPTYIGQFSNGDWQIVGGMDDLRVYNTDLNASQIDQIYGKAGIKGGVVSAGDDVTGLDAFGRVVDQMWTTGTNGGSGTIEEEYQYTYDADGNVLSKTNVVADQAGNYAFDLTYTYNGLNELMSADNGTSNVQSFALDALGNITSQTNGTSSAVTSTFNAQNELTTDGSADLSFDNDGNTLVDDAGQTLIYNAWDELIAVNNTAGTTIALYTYDGDGQRITETDNGGPMTVMYYDASDQLVEQDVAKSDLTLQAQYVWDAGAGYQNALVLRDYDFTDNGAFQINERDYALQDADWSTTAVVGYTTVIGDANADGTVNNTDLVVFLTHSGETIAGGAAVGDFNDDGTVDNTDLVDLLTHDTDTGVGTWGVVSRVAYSPYGVATYLTPTLSAGVNYLAWNIGFQGMLIDNTTNLNFTDTRVYEASTGRFLTVDPAHADGMNWYRGFADNPIKFDDPSGLVAGAFGTPGDWNNFFGGPIRPPFMPPPSTGKPVCTKTHYVATYQITSDDQKLVDYSQGPEYAILDSASAPVEHRELWHLNILKVQTFSDGHELSSWLKDYRTRLEFSSYEDYLTDMKYATEQATARIYEAFAKEYRLEDAQQSGVSEEQFNELMEKTGLESNADAVDDVVGDALGDLVFDMLKDEHALTAENVFNAEKAAQWKLFVERGNAIVAKLNKDAGE